jgi:hypothetical protein
MFRLRQKRKLKKLLNKKLDNNIVDIHKYIADLKEFDFGIVRTMGQLCKRLKIDIPESREIVINSPSWIDEKEKFIEFNNRAWEVMEQEADEVKENDDGSVSLTFDLTKDDEK